MAKKAIFAAHYSQFGHFIIHDNNPKLLHESVIAAFMGVEYGFKVVSLCFQDYGQKGHFVCSLDILGSEQDKNPKLE